MSRQPHDNAPTTDRPTSLPSRALRALVLAVTALALAGCSDDPAPPADADELGKPVRVATVSTNGAEVRLRLPGVVRAVDRADLAFLHAGHLAERRVRRGEAVSEGQALAILHNPALMPGVAAAEARVRELDEQFERLERETERLKNLHERGLISTDELDRVTAQRNAARQGRNQARASLSEAREQLAEATLRAPFDGRIVALPVEPGQFVSPGQTVIALSAPERLEVALALSSRQARRFGPGDEVSVRSLDTNRRLSGTLREAGLPEPGRPANAIIELPQTAGAEWSPGQSVHVDLAWSGGNVMSVPLDALIDTGDGLPHVFRLADEHAILVSVTPGALDRGRVRIEGALEAGDRVVVAGHGQLLDGERVRVLP
jgi:RND family efflux transporter MFP subunit